MLAISSRHLYTGSPKIIEILLACFLAILSVKGGSLTAGYHSTLPTKTEIPLLLNSRQVMSDKAQFKVVIWFDDSKLTLDQLPKPPLKNLKWSFKDLQAGNGKRAITLSGKCIVDKKEEQEVFTWYTIMARKIAREGGRIYLDERVPESLDISAYLTHIQAQPVQWSLTGNLVSIAARQHQINSKVKVGNDSINVQILSRGETAEGQTVLALPVLLEEF